MLGLVLLTSEKPGGSRFQVTVLVEFLSTHPECVPSGDLLYAKPLAVSGGHELNLGSELQEKFTLRVLDAQIRENGAEAGFRHTRVNCPNILISCAFLGSAPGDVTAEPILECLYSFGLALADCYLIKPLGAPIGFAPCLFGQRPADANIAIRIDDARRVSSLSGRNLCWQYGIAPATYAQTPAAVTTVAACAETPAHMRTDLAAFLAQKEASRM